MHRSCVCRWWLQCMGEENDTNFNHKYSTWAWRAPKQSSSALKLAHSSKMSAVWNPDLLLKLNFSNVWCLHSSYNVPQQFSSCSLSNLEQYLTSRNPECLLNKPLKKDLLQPPVCGNGFLETGEECDCRSVVVKDPNTLDFIWSYQRRASDSFTP